MNASRHVLLVAFVPLIFAAPARADAPKPYDPWPGLVTDVFHDKKMTEDKSVVSLDAPARAEDAGLVPMTIHLGKDKRITKVTLVIDGNPSPVAAVFEPGAKADVTMIETRVRVDQYTNVHAVAETADGQLYYAVDYVKAAGGCSAPSPKVAGDDAKIGDMRLRTLPNPPNSEAARREVLLMIRHPNNSGMQMDQITHYYIPARYVNLVKISQGNDPVLTMTGGISLSQDPNFRFDYVSNGASTMRVEATDSTGAKFQQEWPLSQPM
ncbi:MAG TPA: quinoprotein dehydrogenase-associated SoxYZ-like carrier [Methylovirgula sp.]